MQIELSDSFVDEEWDSFLENTPAGQYEQASFWARAKACAGWRPIRAVFHADGRIVAGFQILRKTFPPLGSIGYINKGPTLQAGCEAAAPDVAAAVLDVARRQRIRALIVQPPDNDSFMAQALSRDVFLENRLYTPTRATLILDLTPDLDALYGALKSRKRQNIQRAVRAGVSVVQGDRNDLPDFYSFMATSCRRQNVKPNPRSCRHLANIWDELSAVGKIRLFVTRQEDELLSGVLAISFGRGIWLWKFGWSGKGGNLRPNDLLYWETIKWAKETGYAFVDLVSVDPKVVEALSSDKDGREGGTSDLTRSPTFFKIGFGGRVVMLQEDRLYLSNPMVRRLYRARFGIS